MNKEEIKIGSLVKYRRAGRHSKGYRGVVIKKEEKSPRSVVQVYWSDGQRRWSVPGHLEVVAEP